MFFVIEVFSMYEDVKRFDMKKKPIPCKWYLKPIAWLIAYPGVIAHKPKITKIGMENVKAPYLLLGNHNAFLDMKISAAATFPKIGNYVVAIDGFIGREWLLRNVGCICKRKFTNDISLIRNLFSAVKKNQIPVIYPEARYSLCGTTAPLPRSIGQLIKKMNIPVVTLICHGHHIKLDAGRNALQSPAPGSAGFIRKCISSAGYGFVFFVGQLCNFSACNVLIKIQRRLRGLFIPVFSDNSVFRKSKNIKVILIIPFNHISIVGCSVADG